MTNFKLWWCSFDCSIMMIIMGKFQIVCQIFVWNSNLLFVWGCEGIIHLWGGDVTTRDNKDEFQNLISFLSFNYFKDRIYYVTFASKLKIRLRKLCMFPCLMISINMLSHWWHNFTTDTLQLNSLQTSSWPLSDNLFFRLHQQQ